MAIHPTAIIDPKAQLDGSVEVGPYVIIGPKVKIGEGTSIGPHTVIVGDTNIGKRNRIFQFASVGAEPWPGRQRSLQRSTGRGIFCRRPNRSLSRSAQCSVAALRSNRPKPCSISGLVRPTCP